MKKTAPTDLLAAAVKAAGQGQLLDELAGLYARLEGELAANPVRCNRCGRCCDFAAFGHRLYVTPIELALLVKEPAPDGSTPALRCPYQLEGQCSAHNRRTLGCRVFFCGAPREREQALYEPYHAQLRALHGQSGVPYLYVELTDALSRIARG